MLRRSWVLIALLAIVALVTMGMAANKAVDVPGVMISGKVVDDGGKAVRGATVTAFTDDMNKSVSVYSQNDGSFNIDGLPMGEYQVRARLIGKADAMEDVGHVHEQKTGVKLAMATVSGEDLQLQRPANELLGMLKFDDEKDALNFKMMCTYCHQVGTLGFRSPEEPVDWEVMLTRMDGFVGLYEHTRESLVDRIVSTYGREAEAAWPEFVPPEAPKGASLEGRVQQWNIGKQYEAMIHDVELDADGMVYTVDMTHDAIHTLDPNTGETATYPIPGGKDYDSSDPSIKGPHSIEMANNGDMWVTLALSGEMGRFDPKTKEWRVVSGHEAPRPRAGYPHTLRVDKKDLVWWTDAALGVFSLDTNEYNAENNTYLVKFYKLPDADQVRGGGARGESRGVTPYGIDIAPNGHIWYTKLNGQRVGRIDPELEDGDPQQIVEWKPPVHGPRRLHVAPNGLVWVPGWASGDIASFDPETEKWKVYDLPAGPNALPYALNISPVTGDVWITGTGTDSMLRFDPKTETFTDYRMPTQVTYTREIEFDAEGNVWTVNSNYPPRHIEDGYGSVIKVSVQ